ncbi:MAG: type 1 glutamine amidotransferase domain-containing protein [Akkermansiaceae bacterium]
MKKLIVALVALPLMVFGEEAPILLVLTNHAELGKTGKKTGFFLSEAAHPYKVFTKDGIGVTLASPEGGFAPIDPKSLDLKDEANASFWEEYGNGNKDKPGVEETLELSKAVAANYSAIFFAGGHGTVWDFPDSKAVQSVTAKIYENGGVVGAVCHGPAALVHVKLSDGSHLLNGKNTAVFTNAEEEAVGLTKEVPFLLETAFEKAGATVKVAENFTENAVRDGRLITGQNPASAEKTAELLVEALK